MSEQIVQVADASPSTKNMRTIQQTAGGNTVQSEVVILATGAANGGDTYDARQIRTLTSTDIVTAIIQSAVFKANNSAPTNAELSLEVKLASLGSTLITSTLPISGTVTANQGTANTIANAWPQKISDGTNTAAVTSETTPPTTSSFGVVTQGILYGIDNFSSQPVAIGGVGITGSEALAVVPFGNGSAQFNQDAQGNIGTFPSGATLLSGSLSANGQAVSVTPGRGEESVAIYISGSWSGILQFQYTIDGSTYIAYRVYDLVNDKWITNGSTTVNGAFLVGAAGFNQFRIQANSWASGSASVSVTFSGGNRRFNDHTSAPGQSLPPLAAQVAGSNGTTLQPLSIDPLGNLKVITANPLSQTTKGAWGPGWGNFTGW